MRNLAFEMMKAIYLIILKYVDLKIKFSTWEQIHIQKP